MTSTEIMYVLNWNATVPVGARVLFNEFRQANMHSIKLRPNQNESKYQHYFIVVNSIEVKLSLQIGLMAMKSRIIFGVSATVASSARSKT